MDGVQRQYENWFSAPAEDMFKIAVCMAGFDEEELKEEIIRLDLKRPDISRRLNVTTILNAMQNVSDRYDDSISIEEYSDAVVDVMVSLDGERV